MGSTAGDPRGASAVGFELGSTVQYVLCSTSVTVAPRGTFTVVPLSGSLTVTADGTAGRPTVVGSGEDVDGAAVVEAVEGGELGTAVVATDVVVVSTSEIATFFGLLPLEHEVTRRRASRTAVSRGTKEMVAQGGTKRFIDGETLMGLSSQA